MSITFRFIQGRRSKNIATEDGHTYGPNRRYKDSAYYHCLHQKQGCKARLTLNLKIEVIVKINNEHNHDVDVVDLAVREVRHKFKQAATSSSEAPKRIVANVVNNLGHEVLQNLPSDVALNKCIWTARKDKNKHPPSQILKAKIV